MFNNIEVRPLSFDEDYKFLESALVTFDGNKHVADNEMWEETRPKCVIEKANVIIKIDPYPQTAILNWELTAANQGFNEMAVWNTLDEADRQFFVPTVHYGLSVDEKYSFSVQTFEPIQFDEEEIWLEKAESLFDKYDIGDFEDNQYGVSPEGDLRIFDYGWFQNSSSGRRPTTS